MQNIHMPVVDYPRCEETIEFPLTETVDIPRQCWYDALPNSDRCGYHQ